MPIKRWTPRLAMTHFPYPEQPKALAVPADHGFRLDDDQGRSPIAPSSQSHAHQSRSADLSLGRFTERRSTESWCRRARFSRWSVARDLKAADAATANT